MEKDPLGTRNRETKVYADINIRNAMVDDADTFIHIISGKSRHSYKANFIFIMENLS